VNQAVAIIGGTGPEGRGLALRWAQAGLRVIIGSRDENRARMVAQEISERVSVGAVEGMENAAAAAATDLVVLAVPFEGQAAIMKHLRESFRPGTTLVTTVVPLAAGVGDRSTRTLGVWQGSAAQQAAELAPPGVQVVAALQNVSAALLNSGVEVNCDVIVCADDARAKQIASQLARKIPGVRALDGGGLENARLVEQITPLLITLNLRHKARMAGIRITGIE
jgi:hypothetical protein